MVLAILICFRGQLVKNYMKPFFSSLYIMIPAKPFRPRVFPTKTISLYFMMMRGVPRFSYYFKILNTVIQRIPIFVMDNFTRCQKSFNVFFNNQSMLTHIASSVGIRMFRLMNKFITTTKRYSSFPPKTFFLTHYNFLPFMSTNLRADQSTSMFKPERFNLKFSFTNFTDSIYTLHYPNSIPIIKSNQ